jgi:hypothetical protein
MIQILIKETNSNESYLGEEWLMTGNPLTKYEFDKAFKLAKQAGYQTLDLFWEKVSLSVTNDQRGAVNKHDVLISNLIVEQLRVITDVFKKTGDSLLEKFIAEFESKISCVSSSPFSYPACMNYPSNEKVKPVRYILCGDYKIVYQANKYFVHLAFIAHSSRCKKLLKDKFSHW